MPGPQGEPGPSGLASIGDIQLTNDNNSDLVHIAILGEDGEQQKSFLQYEWQALVGLAVRDYLSGSHDISRMVESAIQSTTPRDTGWRDISESMAANPQLATSKQAGSWLLRRRGDSVLLQVTGLATDRVGLSHTSTALAGFNSLWSEERSKPGDAHVTGAVTKNRLWVNSLLNNNSSAQNFRLQWITADPWPTDLPGVAAR